MKGQILFISLFFSLAIKGQISFTEYDNLIKGMELHFDFDDKHCGYSARGEDQSNGVKFWKLNKDTLTIFSKQKKRDKTIWRFVIVDSLSMKEIVEKGDYSQTLYKVKSIRWNLDSCATNYEYDNKNKLSSIKIFKKGILINWRQFNIDNTISEKNFSNCGILQSQGMWTNGKRTGDWKYYDAGGIFVETKHLSD